MEHLQMKIMKYIKTYENITQSIKFNSFAELTNDDLRTIAKWGLGGYYDSSSCNDEENSIECAVEDFKSFLSVDYPIELGNVPKKLVVYRYILLKDESLFNKERLGISWFSNPKQSDNKCFFDMLDYLLPMTRQHDNGSYLYLIAAETDESNVNIPATLWERSIQWCENEIVMINDSVDKIKVISIQKVMDM